MHCALSAALSPARSLPALLLVLAVLLQLFSPAAAQETTITREDDGAVVATSIQPTVYTTDGAVLTFEPTTPSTPIPQITSKGSVMNALDYFSTRTATGVATGSYQGQRNAAYVSDNGVAGLAVPGVGVALAGGLAVAAWLL
ncbi:hypothetical protein JCM10207_005531 [Rhodosporidiobolus poonsookiae]